MGKVFLVVAFMGLGLGCVSAQPGANKMASGVRAKQVAKITVLREWQTSDASPLTNSEAASKEAEPWWVNRVAPPIYSVLGSINEPNVSLYPAAYVAAVDLLLPLDWRRALSWDRLWMKDSEHPSRDRLNLEGSIFLISTGTFRQGGKLKGIWFLLSQAKKCEGRTVLVARWLDVAETAFLGGSEEYKKELERVLRAIQVAELKCDTSELPELTALAAGVDDLSFSSKVICDPYLNPLDQALPGFTFRLWGRGDRAVDFIGGVGCGESQDGGTLLSWYARAVKLLEKLRRMVEAERLPRRFCSLVIEDGVTFLEKNPPHPPLDLEEGPIEYVYLTLDPK